MFNILLNQEHKFFFFLHDNSWAPWLIELFCIMEELYMKCCSIIVLYCMSSTIMF